MADWWEWGNDPNVPPENSGMSPFGCLIIILVFVVVLAILICAGGELIPEEPYRPH